MLPHQAATDCLLMTQESPPFGVFSNIMMDTHRPVFMPETEGWFPRGKTTEAKRIF